MRIIMEAPNKEFETTIFYSYGGYLEEFKRFPIYTIRPVDYANGHILLEYEIDLFALPTRENKGVDMVFRDGIVHNYALYKPREFTIGVWFGFDALMLLLGDIFLTRGVFKCTVETDWGTTCVANIRAIEFDEYKKELTFDNPSLKVDVTQYTELVFKGIGNIIRLFPAQSLYPSSMLYAHYIGTPIPLEPQAFPVTNPDNAILKFVFQPVGACVLSSITINGFTWTLGDIPIFIDDVIIMDYALNKITHNGATIGTTTSPQDVGQVKRANSIDIVATNDNGEFGTCLMTITSSGQYNTIQ